jgi:hypothetical protein
MRAASAAVIGLLGLGCPLVLVAIVDPFLVKREEPRRRIFALSNDPVTTPLRKYFGFFCILAVATVNVKLARQDVAFPTTTGTSDRYDVPIGGITWHVKDGCF